MAMQMNGFNFNAIFSAAMSAMTAMSGKMPALTGNAGDILPNLLNEDSVALSDQGAAAAADAGSVVSADDDVDADAAKAADGADDAAAADDKKDPEQIRRDAFDKNFTRETVANLFGKEPDELTDEQSKNLNDLLYGINEENAKRAEEGKDPMTREEVNAFIADAVSKYKDDMENDPDSLGKTLSELGLEEGLDEETYKNIEEALKQYNESDEAKEAAEEAKKAEEEKKTEEEKKEEETKDPAAEEKAADQAAADQAQQAGNNGGGGGGGGGNGGGVSGVGGNNNNTDNKTGQANETGDNLPDNLDELQALRSEKQGNIDELKGKIDDKQAAINDRREEIIDKALGDEKNALSDDYKKAKEDFETAKTAKDAAQQKVTGLNSEAAANDQAISANHQARSSKQSLLSQAESELASLSDPGDDDPAGHADYVSRKAAIEEEIAGYKREITELEAKFQDLQNEKDRIADEKMAAQQEIDTQQMAMDDAQARMDEAAAKLSEDNEEIKKALEEDTEIQKLQEEMEQAQNELATAEQELSAIEAKITTKEMEDPEIREIRKEEAEYQFNKAAEDAEAPLDEARSAAENTAAQDKYGKPYAELNDDEKKALEAEITGVVTTELMDWAKDRLMEDPYNSEAMEIIENGYTTLAAQEQEACEKMQGAMESLPKDMQKGAKAAMEEAIARAEEAGEDPNIAAMQALKAFSDEQIGNGLDGDNLKAMRSISSAAGNYAEAMERVTEGVNDLNDADFMQEMATLPEPQRSEVAALRNSVSALGEEQQDGSSLAKAREDVDAYLKDHPDLTMAQAQEKFGVYGPAALAAAQDPEVAEMIEAEAKGEDVLDNQKAEIFMQGVGNYANAQAAKATGEEAKKWEAVGLDADKAVKVATNPEIKAMLEAISPNIVELYVDGDIEGLNEDLLNRLAQVGEILGTKVHITSGFRTYEEQAKLYQMYLNGTGNLAAKPGTSRHETGNAADCSIGGMNIGAYPGAVEAMKQVGLGLPVGGENWHVEISDSFRGL
ncbi:MAG: D-alanyl-D-alanine carboxypeptidase family protein [bacterium]|nr:D-alanyl-D-alanine carboxypeptidase family protein [bacterium]